MPPKSTKEQPADHTAAASSRGVIRGLARSIVGMRELLYNWIFGLISDLSNSQLSNSQIENLTFAFLQEMQDYKICTVDTSLRPQYVSGIVSHYPDPGAPCFAMA